MRDMRAGFARVYMNTKTQLTGTITVCCATGPCRPGTIKSFLSLSLSCVCMCVCVYSKAVCPSAVRLLCSHRVLSSAGMSAAALEDLRRQQRAVDERLAAVAGAAKRLRRAERAAVASAARAWNLAGRVRNVVLLINMLSTNDLEPAVLYLRQRGRQNHWPDREDEELAALATEAFLAASVEEIAAL